MSERTGPGFRASGDPWRWVRGALARLRSVPGRLRFTLSRDLDAKPEELIEAALRHARRSGRMPLCVAASFPLTAQDIEELAREPGVNAIVSKHDPAGIRALRELVPSANLGGFWEPGRWLLPGGAAHVYFIGSWRLVTVPMLREAFRHRLSTLTVRCGLEWVDLPLQTIWRIAAGRRIVWSLSQFLRKSGEALRRRISPLLHGLPAGSRADPSAPLARSSAAPGGFIARPLSAAMLTDMIEAARPEQPNSFVPGRVVLVCGNLQPGGAERQLAYTARGVARAEAIESVQVICDMLGPGHPARYDFYLPLLECAGVSARAVERSAVERAAVAAPAALAKAQASFPEGLLLDVANLYREFVRLRPEVVHAWLDWSNTRAGLAAALAGVPRIILSGRNLNPTHFSLYQSYMDPVYHALQALPNVRFLNNSRAGAASYAEWLAMSPDHIKVIYNGLDMGEVDAAQGRAVRQRLGIPADAPLVGGVFRFNAEKRPLLWVEAAARVARTCERAWFVLFGQGALRADIEKSARALGIADRLVMPGIVDDVLPAMQAMDVLLLTSYGEGVPNVVLEAQWVGTPVVATDAGGVAEAVELGSTGWIVDPADPARLAERVCWLLSNPETRTRARAAGPALVGTRFGMQRMIDQTIQAYGLAGTRFTTIAREAAPHPERTIVRLPIDRIS
jgi:glycosyltransferase involved in cell wall biosynthesis